jgi:hypothetical protein
MYSFNSWRKITKINVNSILTLNFFLLCLVNIYLDNIFKNYLLEIPHITNYNFIFAQPPTNQIFSKLLFFNLQTKNFMKKLLFTLSLLVSSCFLFANAGIFETYMSFSLNGGGEFYRGAGGGNPAFAGSTLASNLNPNTQTLVMKLRGVNTFQDNGSNVTSVTMSYRVYLSTSPAPAFTVVNIPQSGVQVGNDKFWNVNSPDINLLAGVVAAGTYNVEIQFDGATNAVNCTNPISANARLLASTATFSTNIVLANELTSFTAAKQDNKVSLNWLTANEKANDNFSIERSKDGKNFEAIAQMKGAFNSSVSKNYNYTDVTPYKGINYYRLKSVDVEGKAAFSSVVSVSFLDKNNKTFVYPNPVHESALKLEHEAYSDTNASILIYDLTGRVVKNEKRNLLKGTNYLNIELNDLSSGSYLLSIDEQLVRFVKQ